MHACTHAKTNTHTRIHTHSHTCMHMHTHAHIHTHAHSCTHSHTCTHMHTFTHMHTHSHTHTHVHTSTIQHTHTQTRTHAENELIFSLPLSSPSPSLSRTQWKKCTFSGDGEFIVAGSHRQHALYIWDKGTVSLAKMLTGQKGETLLDIAVSG